MTTLHGAQDGATVTAVLVSHDGGRWLPSVLDALADQTRGPDRVVAVDTGSTDTSVTLLRERLGEDALVEVAATSGFGEAVEAGLAAVPAAPAAGRDRGADDRDDWVWLLHDDASPAPDALALLLATAAEHPTAAVLGPKLREWPSLRRLLEVGVTISGTGRRETGLERGEFDQGQHDQVRDVLAVNTAGMLVRRSVLDSLGLDPRLPVFGNDVDLGWRAARAGHRVLVAPGAVLFHVEAAHRGVRRTPVTGSFRRDERAAALYTLLVNGPAVGLPFRVVRLLVGTLLRAVGLVLVRAPGEAFDELRAMGSTYLRPWRVAAGRRDRRRTATVSHRDVRHLLAPAWMPYRHGLDFLTDLGTAVAHQAGDLSAARRDRRDAEAGSEPGPVDAQMQSLPEDTGLLARLLVSPVAWVFTVLVIAALVSARGLVGSGALLGGALLPAPGSATDWWHGYLSSSHDLGTGSSSPAAPYLLPLAVLGTVLLGHAGLLVDLVFLLAVPFAAGGAYRFLRRVTRSVPASLWGAAAYGVLVVVTGSVQQGRLGTVAGTLVLPWLAHSALFLGAVQDPDRRVRAAWRTALWLALLTAFVPVAWPVAAVLAILVVLGSRGAAGRAVVLPLLVTLLVSLLLLLPWSVATWSHQGPASWLFEAGLTLPEATTKPSRWEVLLGRPGGGAPAWMSAGVLVAALAALVPSGSRRAVLRAWVVVVVALAATALLAGWPHALTTSPAPQPLWLGFPLVVAQAAGIAAAAVAGAGVRGRLTGASFGWRQPVGLLVVALALATPVVSGLWWVWSGSGGPLDRGRATEVPTYMADAVAADPGRGVLVVRGSRTAGFSYALVRKGGIRLGDDAVLPSEAAQAGLTRTVQDLATGVDSEAVAALGRRGTAYVYAPAPADPTLVGNLDSVSGLSRGSGGGAGSRAWQIEGAARSPGQSSAPDPWRPWLLALQGVALVVTVVLAAPSRRVRR